MNLIGPPTNPIRSFWMGGFEGADHHNGLGRALDMAEAHGHVAQLGADYARAAALGITSVRESIGWRLTETAPGVFDFDRARRMAAVARRHGVQILWTLMHYGTPPDVSLLDDTFIDRFAAFAAAAARVIGDESPDAPIYTPVNEINFLAWAAAETNLVGGYVGDPEGAGESSLCSGYEIKRRLVRATLAGQHAILRIDPRARFMQVEPLVHVVAPLAQPELAGMAAEIAGFQWQTWDLLAGRAEPELGGCAEMLDLVGVNHYHNGQWEVGTERRLRWDEQDPRRRGFCQLLEVAWQRYGRPLVVSETSHVGAGRSLWLSDIASQVQKACARGVPVWGLCLYPLVDRPDWNKSDQWHDSGLWDVARKAHDEEGWPMARLLYQPYADMLARWQARLPAPVPEASTASVRKPWLFVFSQRRWGLVMHRTQHLMTSLSRHYRIAFMEAPRYSAGEPALVQFCAQPDVAVLCPSLPATSPGFDGGDGEVLLGLLWQFAREHGVVAPMVWVAAPQAATLALAFGPSVLIYDCATEEAGEGMNKPTWDNAHQALLAIADQVFVANRSLFDVVRQQRADAVLLPNAVDAAHFSATRSAPHGSEAEEAQRLLRKLGEPLLAYVGRIDERLDMALLVALADARPQWQFVLVGPIGFDGAQSLPWRHNLHWLGPQPYSLLPHLLARFDVCLLPMVCGKRRLNHPPQLLEYLVSQRPVVATASVEMLAGQASQVAVVADGDAFLLACEAALAGLSPDHCAITFDPWECRADVVHELLQPRP